MAHGGTAAAAQCCCWRPAVVSLSDTGCQWRAAVQHAHQLLHSVGCVSGAWQRPLAACGCAGVDQNASHAVGLAPTACAWLLVCFWQSLGFFQRLAWQAACAGLSRAARRCRRAWARLSLLAGCVHQLRSCWGHACLAAAVCANQHVMPCLAWCCGCWQSAAWGRAAAARVARGLGDWVGWRACVNV